MNLKEYYKEILTNSLNESELATASGQIQHITKGQPTKVNSPRAPREDLVLHQASRVSRILASHNQNNQNNQMPSNRADRLIRLGDMTGMRLHAEPTGKQTFKIRTQGTDGNFRDAGTVGHSTEVSVGTKPTNNAVDAKMSSYAERYSRLAAKTSRPIGGV
jgi:hypothetical protein